MIFKRIEIWLIKINFKIIQEWPKVQEQVINFSSKITRLKPMILKPIFGHHMKHKQKGKYDVYNQYGSIREKNENLRKMTLNDIFQGK